MWGIIYCRKLVGITKDNRELTTFGIQCVVGVERLKSPTCPPTNWNLLVCNNIELDTVSYTLPEPSVYKVRPFQVSKWDQFKPS